MDHRAAKMKQRNADLFVQDRRQEKLAQFTVVLLQLSQLVDWPGLAAAVN